MKGGKGRIDVWDRQKRKEKTDESGERKRKKRKQVVLGKEIENETEDEGREKEMAKTKRSVECYECYAVLFLGRTLPSPCLRPSTWPSPAGLPRAVARRPSPVLVSTPTLVCQ